MGKRKGTQQKIKVEKARCLMCDAIPILNRVTPETLETLDPVINALNLVMETSLKSPQELVKFFDTSRGLRDDPDIAPAFQFVKKAVRKNTEALKEASHWEKRRLVHDLGIDMQQYSLEDLLKIPQKDRPFHVRLIKRSRIAEHTKIWQRLSDYEKAGYLAVTEKDGFYRVPVSESVIFYSEDASGNITIELAVIRDIAGSSSFREPFYSWLQQVVDGACLERRNVRPTHPGKMTQLGLNLGPRHARVLGWAKSFTKKLDSSDMVLRDLDCIGAVSVTWSILQAVMPQEIISHVNDCLATSGLPKIATRNVPEDVGFYVELKGKKFKFPQAERAPPEAYMSCGYEAWTHKDPAYCKYAFAFCVARITPPTRSCAEEKQPGAHFVDADLKVVVLQAPGTGFAFRPDYIHGTTFCNGAVNYGISIAFSERVEKAWREAQKGISVTAGAGAGEGNTGSQTME